MACQTCPIGDRFVPLVRSFESLLDEDSEIEGSPELLMERLSNEGGKLLPGFHGRFIYNTMKIHAVNPGL